MPVPDGREFLPGEDTPGRNRVVILSRGLWERRFGADKAIVGKTVQIDGNGYTVVGIGADEFSFPFGSEVWVPLAFEADDRAPRTRRDAR